MSGAESTGERASRGTDGREKRPLTPRQRQVAGLAAQGKSAKEIAHDLGRSQRTVEEHLAKARERTGAASTAELVALVVLDQAVDGAGRSASSCSGKVGISEQPVRADGARTSKPKRRGRPTAMTADLIAAARELLRLYPAVEVARRLQVSRTTLYAYMSVIRGANMPERRG